MDAKAALELVKEVGIARLGGYDGCHCTSCEVQGVHIDVSCRKSSGSHGMPGFYGTTLRVWSSHMDAHAADLEPVAREVARQIREHDEHPLRARFCDFQDDHGQRCIYCRQPRVDPDGYLCEKCFGGKDAWGDPLAERYDYRRYDFQLERRLNE